MTGAKAKAMPHEIWQAETQANAEKAFDALLATFEAKYPKSTACLVFLRKFACLYLPRVQRLTRIFPRIFRPYGDFA